MAVTGVAEHVQRRTGAYWRDLAFGRLAPALFFSLFLARQLILLWGGIQGLRQPADLLFVGQQLLALTYFTLLVVLYAVRLPQRGTDHRLAVIVISFSGTFAAIGASFPEARRLVTGGPYSLSRHPVYLGEIATAIGINLATAGWLSALAIVYFVACELLRIRWEERILGQTFPNEYTDYARRVPRYLPNPLSRH